MSKIRSLLQKKKQIFGYEFIVTETISFSTTTYTYNKSSQKAHKKLGSVKRQNLAIFGSFL